MRSIKIFWEESLDCTAVFKNLHELPGTISFQFYTFEKVPDSPIFRKQLVFLDDQMPVSG